MLAYDVFKAFAHLNLTDFDRYYLNKTDNMVLFNLTEMTNLT